MKYLIPAGLILCLLFNSCGTKDPVIMPPDHATVSFAFTNSAKSSPVVISTSESVNFASNKYTIDLLKYYVSNITLVDDQGNSTNYHNYNLIDAASASSTKFPLSTPIPNKNYRKLIFYIGVNQEQNHTGAQEGALNPANGMIWTWTFGYIFFKLEGHYGPNSSSPLNPYRQHLGTDSAFTKVEIPIMMDLKGSDKKININFDVDKLLGTSAASAIDFTVDGDRQSNPGEKQWMDKFCANLSQAFTVTKIE
jgi:hypothetical protein